MNAQVVSKKELRCTNLVEIMGYLTLTALSLNISEHITSLAEDEKITSNYKKHRMCGSVELKVL